MEDVEPYEIQQEGTIFLSNVEELGMTKDKNFLGSLEFMVASNGKMWVNVNGIALLRITPKRK